MTAGNLSVEYGSLEAAATAAVDAGEAFIAELNRVQSMVGSMEWTGAAGNAFRTWFETLYTQMQPVQETLAGYGSAIESASTAFLETDEAIAASTGG